MGLKQRLTSKITRERMGAFMERHASTERGVEVGAKERPYGDLFPNLYTGDLMFYASLDAQFDAHAVPFADNSLGLIVCNEVLEHCTAPQQAIDEFFRVLKPGGKLILTTRFIFPLHDAPHDYFRFTRYGLKHLCRGFASVEVESETATVETMGVLMQRLARQVDWKLPLVKLSLYLLARVAVWSQRLVRREFGDIRREQPERDILASGYYLVAVK